MTTPNATTPNAQTPILDHLDQALEHSLKLARVTKVADLLQPGRASYVRELPLTFAEHFDIKPAFFILDPLFGTVALVEPIWPDGGSAEQTVQEVRKCVDRATYL